MTKNLLLGMLLCVSILFTSCATIFTGTKDVINFDSKPQGATVYIDGLEVCKTPCQASVKRSLDDTTAEFKLDGYETRVIKLDRKFNLVSILNFGGLLGWGVDALTGSIMKYDRKHYDLKMNKLAKTLSEERTLKIEINTKDKKVDFYVAKK